MRMTKAVKKVDKRFPKSQTTTEYIGKSSMYFLSRSTVKTFNNSQGTSADINKIQQWFIANIDGSAYHWTKLCD